MTRPLFPALLALLAAVAAGCATGAGDELGALPDGGTTPVDASGDGVSTVTDDGPVLDASTDAPVAEVDPDAAVPDAAVPDGPIVDAPIVDAPIVDAPVGETSPFTGAGGKGIVAGGVKAESGKYQLITTTGQSPGGNAVLNSGKYQLRGGVVGVTQ